METRALKHVLSSILEQVDTMGSATISADRTEQWPEGVLARLVRHGLIVQSSNECGMVCNGCEESCWVEPELHHRGDGTSVLIHACERRADVGLVELDAKRLQSWRLNFDGFAAALASSLGLSGSVEEIVAGRIWRLGWRRIQGRRKVVFFGHGVTLGDGPSEVARGLSAICDEDSLLLVPFNKPSAQAWGGDPRSVVAIAEMIEFGADGLVLPLDCLLQAGSKKKAVVRPVSLPKGTTWEKVLIRVLDDQRAEILGGRKKEIRTFGEMGMRDSRRAGDEPNVAWTLLLVLAGNGGTLEWGDKGASDNARAHMKLLRNHLRELFGIEDDPIKDYKRQRRWQTKFTLVDQHKSR
jgi:hypothetical protein